MSRYGIAAALLAAPLLLSGSVPANTAPGEVQKGAVANANRDAEDNYRRAHRLADPNDGNRDYATAALLYRKAAEAGYAPAQFDLGHLYENGLGVGCDPGQAAKWYLRAAEQGDSRAQNNLGVLNATGRGVPRNYVEAARWYRMASEENNPNGTSNLAVMYLNGTGVEPDPVRAFRLFRKAAEQGYAVAQNNLAVMYATGQAVRRDLVQAYAWFDIASEGIKEAAERRDLIGSEMTEGEVSLATSLAEQLRRRIAQINGE